MECHEGKFSTHITFTFCQEKHIEEKKGESKTVKQPEEKVESKNEKEIPGSSPRMTDDLPENDR